MAASADWQKRQGGIGGIISGILGGGNGQTTSGEHPSSAHPSPASKHFALWRRRASLAGGRLLLKGGSRLR